MKLSLVSRILSGAAFALGLVASACSDDDGGATTVTEGDGGVPLQPAPGWDTTPPGGDKPLVDGGFALGDAGQVARPDRFVTQVVRFAPGPCAGFGATSMPGIVTGPPEGTGALLGSLDVVSLGMGGEIVLGFGDNAVVDGPGPDFVVFENAFYAGGDPTQIAADLGEVSVSADGETWTTFPCTPGQAPPYGTCAGWHPVYASTKSGVSPFDPTVSGGDAFDLAAVGVKEARFVRIRDMFRTACPDKAPRPTNYGFDLDAIGIVNAKLP